MKEIVEMMLYREHPRYPDYPRIPFLLHMEIERLCLALLHFRQGQHSLWGFPVRVSS